MKVDIIFISFNRKFEVINNLELLSQIENINKIIWVDNGSTDGTKDIVIKQSNIVFVDLPKNIGIGAYNIGAKKSNADIIILLDDDSHIDNSAIRLCLNRFETDDKLGALAFRIVLPATNENVTIDWPIGDVTYFWGCGAAVRKSVWDKLGGYREELFLYGNEYDLCIRIWNEGYKVQYTDQIVAYHRVSSMNRTSGRLVSYSIRNNYIYIKTYFAKKYHLKLLMLDRITWFIRATLSGSILSYFEGLRMIDSIRADIKPYQIDENIQKFYINNQRIFETPWRKTYRKFKFGLLFRVSKNV